MIDVDRHMFICGITGSGKTVFADWVYRNVGGLAVFYNTQLEVRIENTSEKIVSDIPGFREAFNEGARKICFNPSEDDEKALSDLEELIDTIFAIGLSLNKEVKETPEPFCRIFIDEIHEYSPKAKNAKVDRVWKRGRRYGIVGIAISQRPAEVSHSILANCINHVIFRCGDYELDYFRRYRIPVFDNEEAKAHLRKPYHFIVYSQGEIELYPPVDAY